MVLSELGSSITAAVRKMATSRVVDQEVVNTLLKEIMNALVKADVDFGLLKTMRTKLSKKIKLDELPAGVNKRIVIQQAVVEELTALVDPGVKPFTPVREKSNVIMFVGLQGAGKTTTVSKLANYYQRKGWRTCVVCADTFRAGAFDQLKQNAARARVPFYGDLTETNPVEVARAGVEQFKKEKQEIIFVDTSGRHKQSDALFDEMLHIHKAINPDNVVFLMDGNIGQAAREQATAFKNSVDIGSVIITKLDSPGKGGGAITAVAATGAPIMFLGTGEHLGDLEKFDSGVFVRKLMGMGDIGGLVEKLQDVVPKEGQEKMMKRLTQGQFTLRDMYEQFTMVMKMGPLNKIMEMMPGMGQMMQNMPKGVDTTAKLKQMMCIMDSMTNGELDEPKLLTGKGKAAEKMHRESRIARIARGSGRHPQEVAELLGQYNNFAKMMSSVGKIGKSGGMNKGGMLNQKGMQGMAQAMQSMLPPGMAQQMGGMGGLQQMMKSMQQGMGRGGGGAGGMPDMSALMQMMGGGKK